MNFDNTYVQIDLDIIRENFRAISQKAGVPVMVIVKADAYGHGAVQIARHLENECAFFGVSSVLEALELRTAGIRTPILILGHTPLSAFPTLVQEGIRPTIFGYEGALALSREAEKQGVTAPFHLAVDTGMSRIGFQITDEDADICARIAKLPHIEAEGLFSHFATADCADLTDAKAQIQQFDTFYQMLQERGVTVKLRHLDNSAGLMNFDHHYDMVRSGIATYGLYPSSEVDPQLLPLQPALSWNSRITHVKWLEAGHSVSYGGTYVTTAPTRVATVPVGYADGYRRGLSNRFYVLIHGRKAPILGRICMDQLMVDVTNIDDVAVGDRVVLVGRDGEQSITVEQLADVLDTINYEIVCGISRRVPRHYKKDGNVILSLHYLLAS